MNKAEKITMKFSTNLHEQEYICDYSEWEAADHAKCFCWFIGGFSAEEEPKQFSLFDHFFCFATFTKKLTHNCYFLLRNTESSNMKTTDKFTFMENLEWETLYINHLFENLFMFNIFSVLFREELSSIEYSWKL